MENTDKNTGKSIGFGYRERAPFACHPDASRGRLFFEQESPTRTGFQRDRDRIIHSNAFRRLKHKTQVFIAHEGDHYRTRLTHTIEVAQIARALARALRLDEDLAEAVALVHDFGHTPFGHTGEDALDDCMRPYGGFDHNAQSLRIVTALEHRYAEFDGLNLTWETLEGLVKHNGPLLGPYAEKTDKALPQIIVDYNQQNNLDLDRFASLEAQCAAIADDIAYNAHDIDDGLRSGLLSLDALEDVPLVARLLEGVAQKYPKLDRVRRGHELVRRQITQMVEDVIDETQRRLEALQPASIADIYGAGRAQVGFSAPMQAEEKVLKTYLFKNLYFHESVVMRRHAADRVVRNLFSAYMNDLSCMPDEWCQQLGALGEKAKARGIADFISGMTDNYALREHRRWFDQTPELA